VKRIFIHQGELERNTARCDDLRATAPVCTLTGAE
jgi:hypothetical protein